MQHLLDGDAPQDLPPPLDGLGLLGRKTLAGPIFEAELGEEVLAHDHVLELRGLGQ